MKSFFLATFAMALTMVYGQANPVYITAPLTGATYTAGSTIQIRWMNPVSDTITQIVLAKGLATNIQPVSTIASNVATASGSYSWTIPEDLTPGNDYAFALGTSPDVAYTGQFTINAADGVATTTSASASGSTTESASASTTESASVSATSSVASSSAVPSSSVASSPAPSSAPASSSVTKAATSSVSRSASATLTNPTTDSGAMSNKASLCAIALTAFALITFM